MGLSGVDYTVRKKEIGGTSRRTDHDKVDRLYEKGWDQEDCAESYIKSQDLNKRDIFKGD